MKVSNKEEWQALVDKLQASGLTKSEFFRCKQISSGRFYVIQSAGEDEGYPITLPVELLNWITYDSSYNVPAPVQAWLKKQAWAYDWTFDFKAIDIPSNGYMIPNLFLTIRVCQ